MFVSIQSALVGELGLYSTCGNEAACASAVRTVKIDKVEAAAVQQYSTAAEEQSKRLKEAETRASGEQAVDDTTEAVQQGVDQAADAAAEGADRFAEGKSYLTYLGCYKYYSQQAASQQQTFHMFVHINW